MRHRERPSRMGPDAVPGRLGHRGVPLWEQDDGMARGSWSRCSRRVFMLAAGRCAAESDMVTDSNPGATQNVKELASTAVDCSLQVIVIVLATGRPRLRSVSV